MTTPQASSTDRSAPFPLTDIQQAYWIGRAGRFDSESAGSHGYLELAAPELDLVRLRGAADALVARHDMLRAVIAPDGRQQILWSVPPLDVPVLDLRGHDPRGAERELHALRERMIAQPLSLDCWPLFDLRCSLLPDGATRIHLSLDYMIADAVSFGIFLEDLTRLYDEPDRGLPELEASFRDYVLGLESTRSGPDAEAARDYWWRRLDEFPPGPALPLVRGEGEAVGGHATTRALRLDQDRWERLQALGRDLGATPTVLVLAAFGRVLATWSSEPRFALNLTVFNRPSFPPDAARLIGDFTTTSLLEMDASQATFAETVASVQDRLWLDLDHRAVSGVEVARELQRRRRVLDVAAPVVFTSTLNAKAVAAARRLGTVEAVASQTPQVLLDHTLAEQDGELLVNWYAIDSAFEAGVVDDMWAIYGLFLQDLSDGAVAVREPLPPLVPARPAETPAPRGRSSAKTLHAGFVAAAARRPEALAVATPEETVTYGELDRRSRGIAARLVECGTPRGELVGCVLPRGAAQAAAVLGIVRAGAAYLPLEPDLPIERLQWLIERSDLHRIVTTASVRDGGTLPAAVAHLAVEECAPAASRDRDEVAPDDLAYVILTSGSAGTPKGVMMEHGAAMTTVDAMNDLFGVGPGDRIYAISSLAFDLSVYDIFGSLASGAALVVPRVGTDREPAEWHEQMRREEVTIWSSVPALMEMLVEYLEGRGELLAPSVRLVLLSGDWIPVRLPERIRALSPQVDVVSLGGATEAGIWSVFHRIGAVDPAARSIPYGRALPGQQIDVRDRHLHVRPPWVVGEICIGGGALARGYLDAPAETAAAFVVDPNSGERLYRTGDLGRTLPDGTIEILGRMDNQVKIGGHRVELGEVDATLARCPGVTSAGTVVVDDPARRLVAFLVGDATCDLDRVRSRLDQLLPQYMIPALHLRERLPLTANGKVDRKQLAAEAADTVAAVALGHAGAPESECERAMAEIWGEILGVRGLGRGDNFFDLGGDSLLATRVAAAIRSRLGVELPLRQLFAAATLADAAAAVDDVLARRTADDLEAVLAEVAMLDDDDVARMLLDLTPDEERR